jgi:hypothetical protein
VPVRLDAGRPSGARAQGRDAAARRAGGGIAAALAGVALTAPAAHAAQLAFDAGSTGAGDLADVGRGPLRAGG